MKIRITTRLFLAVLATATVAVAGMVMAAQWSLTQGFLGYVNEQSLERLKQTLPALRAAYEEHGNWEFLRRNHRAWIRLLVPRRDDGAPPLDSRVSTDEGLPHQPQGLPLERGLPPPRWRAEDPALRRALPVSELTGAILRWGLRDANHQWVVGYDKLGPDAIELSVVVDSKAVGYVAMAPFESVAAAGAQRFTRSQLEATVLVGALAVGLAALIALWASVTLMRPLRRVARATHALAAGDYATRVAVRSQDELGALAGDFNRLAETLQKNASVRRSLFADISHELRTPLAVLKGELEAIDDGVRPLDRRAVGSLLAEVDRLSQLVADVHEFALADTGSLSYRMQPVNLTAVLCESMEAFEYRFKEHGLTLLHKLPEGALVVNGDEARLRQVFNNLLENALRYTDTGGEVEVSAQASGNAVRVVIQDSAPGVAPDELPRLFERFYRSDMPGVRGKGGSGLGLAISRAVAEAHGGSIEAGASPLGGVAVTLNLSRLT